MKRSPRWEVWSDRRWYVEPQSGCLDRSQVSGVDGNHPHPSCVSARVRKVVRRGINTPKSSVRKATDCGKLEARQGFSPRKKPPNGKYEKHLKTEYKYCTFKQQLAVRTRILSLWRRYENILLVVLP